MNPVNPVCVRNILNDRHEAGKAPMETFRKDLFNSTLLPMIELRDLAALSLASKKMCIKTTPFLNRIWERRRAEITIGPDQWKSVGFEVKEIPRLPYNIDEILKGECPYFEGKRVYQTHKLILIPSGLSVSKQGRLMSHLREGENETIIRLSENERKILILWHAVYWDIEEKEVAKPYWVLVTTDVIPGSRKKSFFDQKELMKKEYVLPSVLDAIVFATMDKECSSKKREYLQSKFLLTYTRSSDSICGWRFAVSAVSSSGLYIDILRDTVRRADVGVLALRKFC